MFYHGSSIGKLAELNPFVSEHGKPYIYFASNPVVALFYTVKAVEKPFSWYPYGFKNGIPVYTEYYPNALADVYKGKTGYIYEFERIDGAENPTDINCACVCSLPVKTDKITEIPDVYEMLLEHEKNGELIIERYDFLSESRKLWIENTIKAEIAMHKLKSNSGNSYESFIKSRFPNLYEEVK